MQELIYHWTGERIDKWLCTQFPFARNFFHHIIERWGVILRGKPVKKSYQLKEGNVIIIDDLQRYLSPVLLDEAPVIDIPIVLEKDDYLVINKPKGVLSHPNSVRDISHPSVVGFLYHKYKNLPSIGNFIRAGLLHRLDKETDGLMILAKTEKGLGYFKQLFQARSETNIQDSWDEEYTGLRKFYRASCEVTEQGQTFLDEVKDHLPFTIEEMVVPKVPYYIPKMGITKIISIQEEKIWENKRVKLELEILTGRTHQIRYHLSQHGLPIVWDYLYGDSETKEAMHLTAYRICFTDPEEEVIDLKI